jgi:hypothetical protein
MTNRFVRRVIATAFAVAVASVVVLATGGNQHGTPSWGLDRIDQRALAPHDEFHYILRGDDVGIYIIDTGVRASHNDLYGHVISVGDFCSVDGSGNPTSNSSSDVDPNLGGHGTHNASIAGGQDYGVAKGAVIYALRAFCSDGPDSGSDNEAENLVATTNAVYWIRNHASLPSVVNISFSWDGSAYNNSPLYSEVTSAIGAGFVFTLSAGCDSVNNRWGSYIPSHALVAAGTYDDDTASGVDYGGDLAVFAPAWGMKAAGSASDSDEYEEPLRPCADSYAAAYTAGVAAMALSGYPSASPDDIRAMIVNNATPGVLSGRYSGTTANLLFSGFMDEEVSFQSYDGHYLAAENNGDDDVNADRSSAGAWETWTMIDLNGGALQDGDSVAFRTSDGWFLQADSGGGGSMAMVGHHPYAWETFTIVTLNHSGGTVGNGDTVTLQTYNGHYMSASGGGGSSVNASASSIGAYESFTYTIH